MIEGEEDDLLRVHIAAENAVFNETEGVREHCHRVGMLHDVLFARTAHELPPLDELHAVHIGVKLFHIFSFAGDFI